MYLLTNEAGRHRLLRLGPWRFGFVKNQQPQLGCRQGVRFEAAPDELALDPQSGDSNRTDSAHALILLVSARSSVG